MAAYRLVARDSRFTVKAFAEGLLSSLGHNPTLAIRDFEGRLEFDPASPEKAALDVTVKATSLEVMDDVSKKDRQEIESRTRDEVLEAGKHPEIVYQATAEKAESVAENQFRLSLSGTLSLHGVRKTNKLDVQLRQGESDVRLRGEFRLRTSDYGIKRVSALAGALKVKDELQFSLEIVGVKE